MSSLPPSVSPADSTGADPQQAGPQPAGVYALLPEETRRPWLRFALAGIVLALVILLLLVSIIPGWRNAVSGWIDDATGTQTSHSTRDLPPNTAGQVLTVADLPATATSTPTPHPALSLSVTLEESVGSPRWQIAYPDATRGPGLGCAYLSFRLTGPDAANLALLDQVDAELVIYDGEFVFERYGPLPLKDLRGLADSQYYELPGGGSACGRHRFSEPEEYAGLEFRLSLLAGDTPVQTYRYGLTGDSAAFATITPTALPSTITPTPYPQARIRELINVRSGPGTAYTVLGSARKDDVYAVTASDEVRQWWQIDYQGQTGWVYAPLVEVVAVDAIAVAQVIPPAPPPPATVAPTATPAPPAPAPTPYFPFLLSSVGVCDPNPSITYFEGKVLNRDGTPMIGACVHIAYDGPRQTKCTGCDGNLDAKWGFAPFGNLPGKSGSTVRIYVVPCPESGITGGSQTVATGFGPLTPVSPVWTYTIGESVQCTGITFQDNRFFDESGQQIPPPAPTLAPSPNELFRFKGDGQAFTDPFVLSAGPVRFRISLTGAGNYSLQLLSSIGRNIDILASGNGAATVDKTVTIDANGTYFVSVIADGPWTILVETP